MPYLGTGDVHIYYEVHDLQPPATLVEDGRSDHAPPCSRDDRPCLLMIMGEQCCMIGHVRQQCLLSAVAVICCRLCCQSGLLASTAGHAVAARGGVPSPHKHQHLSATLLDLHAAAGRNSAPPGPGCTDGQQVQCGCPVFGVLPSMLIGLA